MSYILVKKFTLTLTYLSVKTEAKLTSEIARTLLLPAAFKYATELSAVADSKSGKKLRSEILALADQLSDAIDTLDKERAVESDTHSNAKQACAKVLPAMLEGTCCSGCPRGVSSRRILASAFLPRASLPSLSLSA
jgi:glutamine synthetase type III